MARTVTRTSIIAFWHLSTLFPFHFRCRGISHEKLAQYDEAIKDFTRVIELDPHNINAFFNRGSAHDSNGAYQLAVKDYTAALSLEQNAPKAGQQCKLDGF